MNQQWEGNSPKVKFTYNDKSSSFQSPGRPSPKELSVSYIPRATSLPQKFIVQQRPQDTNHIKIIENSVVVKQRTRRHKIFQQSPLLDRKSESKAEHKPQAIHLELKNTSPQKTPQKQTISLSVQTVEIVNQDESRKIDTSKRQDLDITQLNLYIDKKLTEKLSELDSIKGDKSMRQSVNHQELRRKEHQIHYLKMQVERLKRCEKLNKENESLYSRLVGKLKQHTTNHNKQQPTSYYSKTIQSKQNSPQKQIQKTPIAGLNEFRNLEIKSKQTSNLGQQNIIVNKKTKEATTQPLKYATAPQQFFISAEKDDFQQIRESSLSKAMTFNNSRQTGRGKTHSRRIRMQVYPIMLKMQDQIYSQEPYNNFSELPISNRLEEINHKLQRKMTRRSESKHKKDFSLTSTLYVNTIQTLHRTNPRYHKFMY